MSVSPMNVMLPGRPDGQVEHIPPSGWRVCESSGRCAVRRPSLSTVMVTSHRLGDLVMPVAFN
jgi:hypothetical protein